MIRARAALVAWILAAGCGGGEGSESAPPAGTKPKAETPLQSAVPATPGSVADILLTRMENWGKTKRPATLVFEEADAQTLQQRASAQLNDLALVKRLDGFGRLLQALQFLPGGYRLGETVGRAWLGERTAVYDRRARRVLAPRAMFAEPVSEGKKKELDSWGELPLPEQHLGNALAAAFMAVKYSGLEVLETNDIDGDDARLAAYGLFDGQAWIQGLYAARQAPVDPTMSLVQLSNASSGPWSREPNFAKRLIYLPTVGPPVRARLPVATSPSALPITTEQLYHPASTVDQDPPVAVFLPDLSGSIGGGRSLTFEATLGEVFLAPLIMFTSGYGFVPATSFTDQIRWDGDRAHLYERAGAAPVVVIVSRWKSESDAMMAYGEAVKTLKGELTLRWSGQDLAIVAGLPTPEGMKVAEEALGRAVRKPYRTLEELRGHRKSLSFPGAPAPLPDPIIAIVAILEGPKTNAHFFAGPLLQQRPETARQFYVALAKVRLKQKATDRYSLSTNASAEGGWTLEDINLLAQASMLPSGFDSPLYPKFSDALPKFGASWPAGICQTVEYFQKQRR